MALSVGTAQQSRFSSTSLWRTNDSLAQKDGDRRTIYWVDKKGPSGDWKTSCEYLGEWKDNLKHGKGTQVWSNGSKYIGGWEKGMRTGMGTYWIKTGGKVRKQYAGLWLNNAQHGRGVFYYKNGDCYDGIWRHGVRHGVGIMIYANGDVYEGEWFNDQRHGFGIFDYANGDHFEGSWTTDNKEGEGVHFYYNTDRKTHTRRYDGEWVDDVPKCGIYTEMEPDPEVPASFQPDPLPTLKVVNPDKIITDQLNTIRKSRQYHRAEVIPLDDHFTAEELQALQVAFNRVDIKQRGTISLHDLPQAVAHVGIELTQEDHVNVLAHLSKREQVDDQLTFAEFSQACDFLSPIE